MIPNTIILLLEDTLWIVVSRGVNLRPNDLAAAIAEMKAAGVEAVHSVKLVRQSHD